VGGDFKDLLVKGGVNQTKSNLRMAFSNHQYTQSFTVMQTCCFISQQWWLKGECDWNWSLNFAQYRMLSAALTRSEF